jgi:uncharacterized protein YigA (DUF484 family)
MTADDVARYLKDNPIFFEDYAEMLTQISVPNPHGGKAIALSDRQVLALRDENKALREKLRELVEFGEENDAIGGKIHRLALALLPAPDLSALLSALYFNLREDFAVPHTALRLWRAGADSQAGVQAETLAVSDRMRDYARGLAQPFCGPSGNVEAAGWFGEAASHVRSVAHIALIEPGPAGAPGPCFGLLVLGSADVLRFYPDMGTVYLKRLGELASAALVRFL